MTIELNDKEVARLSKLIETIFSVIIGEYEHPSGALYEIECFGINKSQMDLLIKLAKKTFNLENWIATEESCQYNLKQFCRLPIELHYEAVENLITEIKEQNEMKG